jgi:hypothetical protein
METQHPFTVLIKGRRGVEALQILARDDAYAQRVAAKVCQRIAMNGGGFSPRLISVTPTIVADERILTDATLPDPEVEAPGEVHEEYAVDASHHDMRALEKKERRAANATRAAVASGRIGA